MLNVTNNCLKDLSPETIKSNAIEISYDDLMRNNEEHVGKIVYHEGEVIQVQNVFGNTYVLRVSTEGPYYYDNVIWVNYAGDRLLEDDAVEIWGVVGLKEYSAIFGNSVTIPEIDASILELVEKQSDR